MKLQSLFLLQLLLWLSSEVQAISIKSTVLDTAVERGYVWLGHHPSSYNYFEGFGDGKQNWIVYLEGGGWCTSPDDCAVRSKSYFGTTLRYNKILDGIFSDDGKINPDFFNWNKVFVHYCDGSSYMSNVEAIDPETRLTYRGARIYSVVIEDLITKGLGTAKNAILAGSSAGGLATYLHCDTFGALFSNTTKVKCVADSGFFLHGKDLIGVELREKIFSEVVATHGLGNLLPKTCTSKINPEQCLFPENLVENIKTPVFIIESAFDQYQIQNNLAPAVGGFDTWLNCTSNIKLCTASQIQIMREFRRAFIDTLMRLNDCPSRGMFVHSCIRHTHILKNDGWTNSSAGNVLENKTIGKAVGDWYFDRSGFSEIDLLKDSPWTCTTVQ